MSTNSKSQHSKSIKESLNISNKVKSKEKLRVGSNGKFFSTPKSTEVGSPMKSNRFEYSNTELHFKSLIKITSVTTFNPQNSIRSSQGGYQNLIKKSTASPAKTNLSMSSEKRYPRYKKAYEPIEISKYREKESSISKLNDQVSKYALNQISIDKFCTILSKNNINPESKEVIKILTDLGKKGTSGSTDAFNKLLKLRGIVEVKDLESKIVCSPKKQLYTSYEDNEKKSIDPELVEDNLCIGTKKAKLKLEGLKHHTCSEDVISHTPHNKKTVTVIKVEPVDDHKSKKIQFMSESTAFKQETEPLDNSSFIKAKSGSIMQNYSSKDALHFYDSKKQKNDSSKFEAYNEHKITRPTRDKNTTSEGMTVGLSKEKIKEVLKTDPKEIKIVGLEGKGKSSVIKDVDQNKTSLSNLTEWKIEKTKSISSMKTRDDSLTVKSPTKNKTNYSESSNFF